MLLQPIDDRAAVWIATHRVALLNDPFVLLGYIDKVGAVWVALAVVVGGVLRCGEEAQPRSKSDPAGLRVTNLSSTAL